MKAMKATTLNNRIAKAVKDGSISKNSKAYKVLAALAEGAILRDGVTVDAAGLVRPVFVSGAGRYIKNNDYTADICRALGLVGIKFRKGNDAPRGGACGTFIQIATKIER